MKKLFVLGAFALSSMVVTAQEIKSENKVDTRTNVERTKKVNYQERLSPEQHSELRIKKLTLDLDLSEKQQNKIVELDKNRFKTKEGNLDRKEKLTKDQIFELRKKRLDEEIEYKKEMKSILNKSQFEKWESNKKNFRKKARPAKKVATK